MAATGVSPPPSIDPIQAIAEFKNALWEAGLVLRGDPVMDGKIHRVPVQGARSRGNQSGRYVGYLDEHPAGKIWNYKEGVEMGWRASRPTRPLSEPQRKQREERIKREQAVKEAERLQTEERVAQWARRTWQRATPVDSHPYLTQKGVAAHNLRVDRKNRLLVPMCDLAGNLCSLQSILEDGQKHFTRGGRQIGMHHVIGSPQSHGPLLFAEGYATAASIHQATGLPVVVCFNSGNLLPVVQDFHHRYPDRQLIIAADNDHHLTYQSKPNVGIEKAIKAAEAVSAHAVLVPPFPSNSNGTDWNDYHAQHGLEAVRNLIYQQMVMTKEINMSETTQVQEYEPTTEQV
ncbi:MAG: toprim domain-containing protein, partial [Acidobacteriaceae bacterium]|nr:toprim domain-containing protein [Acidobacteriaceae bacterium]